MSLSEIRLTTNKSISVIDDDRRRVRQSDKGLTLPVILLDINGTPYDLTNKSLLFSENKNGGKVVVDDGLGAGAGAFKITDPKNGRFTYTLQAQSYVESGTCWFSILNGNTVIDSTKNFYIDVIKDAAINPTNDSYISRMTALEESLNAANDRADESLKVFQTKLNGLINDWNNQKNTIQRNADNQLASLKTSNQNSINSAIQSINDNRDKAINQLNADKQKEINNLKNDYQAWKNQTVNDLNATLNGIKANIGKNQSTLADVNKKVADTTAKMAELLKQFSSVDFTQFVKRSETYNKTEIDKKLADKIVIKKFNSPQEAFDASKTGDFIACYDPNDGPTTAIIGDKTITIQSLYDSLSNLQNQVGSLSGLKNLIDGKADTATIYTKNQTDNLINQLRTDINNRLTAVERRKVLQGFDTPQKALDASKNFDGITYYNMNDGPTSATIAGQAVTIESLYNDVNNLKQQVSVIMSKLQNK